ncbi:Protein OSCP1 [Strongyloides ratti]|uniref:Protein OSCP1 n=1 Tax=Strongyloides ratti TaxID=34506 RepID=A0A090MYQ4_STRRB|nr:Protein OSCP1 [Strongyloides ratti]CEF67589.1 Protein OSCP1 [Strongyloides ratti]
MALNVMPIMVINMAGEMIYVLEQRLKCFFFKAQSVEEEKSLKVLCDIISTLTNKEFMEQLFKPQELYEKTKMRHFFEALVHSSIMRLNISSMDKLYALMTMAFKYQIIKCVDAEQLILVTLNHLDEMMKVARNNDTLKLQLEEVYDRILIGYKNLKPWEYYMIRNCLLNYFVDFKIRIALLLKIGKQKENGCFNIFNNDEIVTLPPNGNCPGSIKYYEKGIPSKVVNFEVPYSYEPSLNDGCYDKYPTNRGTDLGLNLYKEYGEAFKNFGTTKGNIIGNGKKGFVKSLPPEGDEMKLLNELINNNKKENDKTFDNFNLVLFDDDEDIIQEKVKKISKDNEENIKKLSITSKKNLTTVMNELNMEKNDKNEKKSLDKGKDLLDLMDEATSNVKKKIPSRSSSAKRTTNKNQYTRVRSSSTKRIQQN